jgi:serine protease
MRQHKTELRGSQGLNAMSSHRFAIRVISAFALALVLIAPSGMDALGLEVPVQEYGKPASFSTSPTLTDEIIVKFRDDAVVSAAALHQRFGAVSTSHSGRARFDVVRVPEGRSVDNLIQDYLDSGMVEYAEPNYPVSITWEPDDEMYPLQWHFDQVNAAAAWDIDRGGISDTIVAVLDTGVAYENRDNFVQAQDFAQTSFIEGWDFINNDPWANDDRGHGTHVAGTIAQSTNNGIGVAGLAFGVTIMPVKVLNSAGSGTIATVAQGIYYAVDNGAHVINMSLASSYLGTTQQDALDYAYENGVVVVCAGGNSYLSGNTPQYPAAYETTIAVGATRYDRTRAPYSNTGAYIDLVAPGGDATVDQNSDGHPDGVLQQTFTSNGAIGSFSYRFLQGTSMASPHVAAAAALVLSQDPSLGPDEVRAILQSTAVDLGISGKDPVYGHGLLDVAAAVEMAAPSIRVSPRRLELEALSGGTVVSDLEVSSHADEPVSYSISVEDVVTETMSAASSWLSVSPESGMIESGESVLHSVTVNASALISGEYNAGIEVRTSNPDDYVRVVRVNLLVTPGMPIVATGDVTDIGETSANGGGVISYVGVGDCDVVGICWSTAPQPTHTGNKAELSGLFGEEAFGPLLMEGLAPGTSYFARAYAHNPAGYGYGGETLFTTLPHPPTGLTVNESGTYHVALEWSRGDGAAWTHVRVKQGDYPADIEDGEPVYDGTGSSYTCGPLDPGVTHYFRAWSRTSDAYGNPVWSENVADITATTDEGDPLTSLSIALHTGWNMVSVPLDLLGFDAPARVFPGTVAAYTWDAGAKQYSSTEVIEPGSGYWIAIPCPDPAPITIRGLPADVGECELFAGWNLVGSFSHEETIALSALSVTGVSEMGPLSLNQVYWWNGTSYVSPSEIEPGKAYWMASSAPCTVGLGAPSN